MGARYDKFWAAFEGEGGARLPIMMVGSGYKISEGPVDFYNHYKEMIEAEKARPPQAKVAADYIRIGNHYVVNVTVTNWSEIILSNLNKATVHVLVYEEAKVNQTGRFIRTATSTPITLLSIGQTDSFYLTTDNISPINWDKVHIVALVDYFSEKFGHYDMLQSAIAVEHVYTHFEIAPDTIVFMMEPEDTFTFSQYLKISGEHDLIWHINDMANWFSITPLQGKITDKPQISIIKSEISNGWQEKTVPIYASDSDGEYEKSILIKAYQGKLDRVYLPFISNIQ